ncbi:MAG: D-alanyl-D-alanine carboxypeptidase/D-alanyl-D-alanine-endopeptidase [Armatimonadota bacterium]
MSINICTKKYNKIFILILAFFIFLNYAVYPFDDLSKSISRIINSDPLLYKGSLSVKIKALNGPVIYSKNENLALMPASCMKILTSAAALNELGEYYTYKTYLYGGKIDPVTGVMYGPLVLEGRGDPTWVYEFSAEPTDVLEKMADYLYKMGVRRIEGDLIADDLFFDREFTPRGWKDEQQSYTSPVSGLSLNANLVSVKIYNNKIYIYPDSPNIKVVNKLGSGGVLTVKRADNGDTIYVKGVSSYDQTRVLPVYDPVLCAITAFEKILNKRGITVAGRVRPANEYEYFLKDSLIKWYENQSCCLIEIIRQMNKESDNFLAEQLFKTISADSKGCGTVKGSREIILDFCGEMNIDTRGVKIFDGSGLSLENRIPASLLVSFLEYIYNSGHGKSFMKTLARGGIDGTLRYRLSGVTVYAKTGTLHGVSSLSGYVKTKTGQTVVFSIIFNNENCYNGYLKHIEDEIVRTIAKYNKPIDIKNVKEITVK